MSLQDALFLVDRGGVNNHCKGSDIGTKMVSGDKVLVQRGTGGSIQHFGATWNGSQWDQLQDTDFLIAWDGAANRMVTGSTFKTLFIPPLPEPQLVTPPQIRFTGLYGSYDTLRYELVAPAIWSRPPKSGTGEWQYTRDGEYWYSRADTNGSYYYDYNVLEVRYHDRRQFEQYQWSKSAYSIAHPIGEPT